MVLPPCRHSCIQGDTLGPLQDVEPNWPAHHCSRSIGQVAPVQAGAAAAGAALASTWYAGTAIASPLITRFMNVRRVLDEPRRPCGAERSDSCLE
jgi:hypothetical protein